MSRFHTSLGLAVSLTVVFVAVGQDAPATPVPTPQGQPTSDPADATPLMAKVIEVHGDVHPR